MKLDILAFAAHPDDAELACSGTLLKHIALGKKVGIVDLTRGELGTRGSAELRKAESGEASKKLGITVRENLGLADGFFVNDEEAKKALIKVIRKYQPEIVFANAVEDRHPDHGRAASLASEACFLSGLRKIETKQDDKPQEAWRPKAVYHYIQDHYYKPDFVIDISDLMEKKLEIIKCFSSQFYDPNSKEPITPISTPEFLDFLYARAAEMGRIIGVKYGEGFTTQKSIGVRNLFDIY